MLANLSVEQSLMKAKSYANKGELAEAQKLYETILKKFSNNIRAQQGLSALNKHKQNNNTENPSQDVLNQLVALYNQGQITTVIKQAELLTKQYPASPIIWNMIGVSRAQIGMLNEAIEAYKKCISLKPDFSDAHFNIGIALINYGKSNEAIEAFNKAISYNPNHAEAYNNLGSVHLYQDALDEAINAYKKAILLKPNYAEAYDNMGVALKNQGNIKEAIKSHKKSILLKPSQSEAYNNIGNALKDKGELEEAIKFFNKALTIKPDYAEAYNNMGNVLKDQGKLDHALIAYNKASSLINNYAEALYNSSFIHNLKGNLSEGLKLYEWRLKKKPFTARSPRDHLIWNGNKSLLGKKFLVYEEQGLGDVIQFCRYLPLLNKKGAEVTFKVQEKMHALLHTLDSNVILVNSTPDDNSIDFESPLMSLPHLFNTNLETIPKSKPYLYADKKKVMSWGNRLTKDKFKVGICWQGSDIGRSFPLNLFKGISKLRGLELISLHKGEGEKQINDIDFDLTILGDDFDSGENAFVDTAAVMANCDLIITSDTSTAHLAGALGRQTWVALKKVPDWRWMLDRKDSPWYPNMKLYRQKKQADWQNVFDRMYTDLKLLINKKVNK
ncbi:MAG: tetratricopeptide repeat protein [Candidatus Puniceispirillales bacterium]